MRTKTAVLAGLFILSSSCAMIQKLTCNSSNAEKVGENDALAGRADKPGVNGGRSCEGEYTASNYERDYLKGFSAKKSEICQSANASSLGKADGLAAADQKGSLDKLKICSDLANYSEIQRSYQADYKAGFCSNERAQKVGDDAGRNLQALAIESSFATCSGQQLLSLRATAMEAHKKAYAAALQAKTDEFQRSTGTAVFTHNAKNYTSVCNINAEKAFVQVVVDNPYAEQTLIQGDWRFIYYDDKFQKLTEDKITEAVLMTPQNKKSFQKLTLPRDATFCRAEYMTPPVVITK